VNLRYDEAGELTMTELGIAFTLMRDDHAMLGGISEAFRVSCAAADLVVSHRRMVERSLVEPHHSDASRCLVTERGQRLIYNAFDRLVRFIDAESHVFNVSMIWSLATRRPPHDEN
jgi:hypothetical protein